jgi:hypothetical protein
MAQENEGSGQENSTKQGGFWARCGKVVDYVNQKFAYFVGLPIVTVAGTLLVSHYQYLSAYDDKVKAIGKEQLAAAESTFSDVSTKFSKAVTLQSQLYFNYRDASKRNHESDAQALETKDAHAIFSRYDALRGELRESIDLMARRVEVSIDWTSNTHRNAAHAGSYGGDPVTRIALGAYDFQCDVDKYMPDFDKGFVDVPAPPALKKENPKAKPLHIDWYSAKHQLLSLYYCFQANHTGIEVVRQWASNSRIDVAQRDAFTGKMDQLQDRLDREAIRLNSFMTLAERSIDAIRVKFRPRKWYCHVPVVRQIFDHYGQKCSPIRTAENGAPS